MVRSHLGYCCPVWSPYRKRDIEALEQVQKRATKEQPALKNLTYEDRLKACNMSTLHYRRVRRDNRKILSGKYDTNEVPNLKTTSIQATRGNDLRIFFKTRFKYDLCKFYFTNRVADARVARSPVFSWSSRISASISRLPDRSQNLPHLTRHSLASEINVLETFCSSAFNNFYRASAYWRALLI